MPFSAAATTFGTGLLVTSLPVLIRSILFCMGIDPAFIAFLSRTAVGAAAALVVILFAGISIPHRAPVGIRRTQR